MLLLLNNKFQEISENNFKTMEEDHGKVKRLKALLINFDIKS